MRMHSSSMTSDVTQANENGMQVVGEPVARQLGRGEDAEERDLHP